MGESAGERLGDPRFRFGPGGQHVCEDERRQRSVAQNARGRCCALRQDADRLVGRRAREAEAKLLGRPRDRVDCAEGAARVRRHASASAEGGAGAVADAAACRARSAAPRPGRRAHWRGGAPEPSCSRKM
eukprot:7284350-Prymnesium_polylepis.2